MGRTNCSHASSRLGINNDNPTDLRFLTQRVHMITPTSRIPASSTSLPRLILNIFCMPSCTNVPHVIFLCLTYIYLRANQGSVHLSLANPALHIHRHRGRRHGEWRLLSRPLGLHTQLMVHAHKLWVSSSPHGIMLLSSSAILSSLPQEVRREEDASPMYRTFPGGFLAFPLP